MKKLTAPIACVGAAMLSLWPLPSFAQDAEAFLTELRTLAEQQRKLTRPARTPQASTVGVASGFGLGHGDVGLGAAFTNQRDRVGNNWDGSAAVSFGFGDARDGVGVGVHWGLVGLDPLLTDGNLSFTLHKILDHPGSGRVSAVAIGASNAISWGDPTATPVNYYVAGSTTFSIPWLEATTRPGMFTLGVGSAVKNIERDFGVFGGVGIGITPWMSGGVSWLGDEAIIGAQFTPQIGEIDNVNFGLYYADATHRVSTSGRIILSISILAQNLY